MFEEISNLSFNNQQEIVLDINGIEIAVKKLNYWKLCGIDGIPDELNYENNYINFGNN